MAPVISRSIAPCITSWQQYAGTRPIQSASTLHQVCMEREDQKHIVENSQKGSEHAGCAQLQRNKFVWKAVSFLSEDDLRSKTVSEGLQSMYEHAKNIQPFLYDALQFLVDLSSSKGDSATNLGGMPKQSIYKVDCHTPLVDIMNPNLDDKIYSSIQNGQIDSQRNEHPSQNSKRFKHQQTIPLVERADSSGHETGTATGGGDDENDSEEVTPASATEGKILTKPWALIAVIAVFALPLIYFGFKFLCGHVDVPK